MAGVLTYLHETDLSKRVQEWERRIKPRLLMEVYIFLLCICILVLYYRQSKMAITVTALVNYRLPRH